MEFDYELPENRIAKHPPARREDARLLHLNARGEWEDRAIVGLPDLVPAGGQIWATGSSVKIVGSSVKSVGNSLDGAARLIEGNAANGGPLERKRKLLTSETIMSGERGRVK